jgi:hypothetical protein
MKRLFTERHGGGKPRVGEALDAITRTALWNLLTARIDEEWFGLTFPNGCEDGYPYAGTDLSKLQRAMTGFDLLWPRPQLDADVVASDGQVFDAVEFAYEMVAEPKLESVHGFMGHSHYSYDQEEGREKFEQDVNRIFERNGMALELKNGEVTRMAPIGLQEALAQTVFKTGDEALDGMLESARRKILSRSLEVRREALEKLWDAWERLKTIEPGQDKRAQVTALLAKGSKELRFRDRLDTEAKELTEIGNKFMIRHTELDRVPIEESAHVDYLFHRMFALIRLLLKASGRGG